ncbi:MAG: phosphoenolpyruvate--protein phosphotransferase [Planctomycetota bacterium]
MPQEPENITFSGISLSPGMAAGDVHLYQDILQYEYGDEEIKPEQVDEEWRRLAAGMEQVRTKLSEAEQHIQEEVSPSLAGVFRAHRQILQDPTLARELENEIETNLLTAEEALQRVFSRWEQRFREMESETYQVRDADVADLARRILKVLLDINAHALENMPPNSVVVARRLYPSDVVFFSTSPPAAIVVQTGSPGSHCALFARELGIPGVGQISEIWEKASEVQCILVDGIHGTVVLSPTEQAHSRFREQQNEYNRTLEKAKSRCNEEAITKSGQKIPVLANIGNQNDARRAADNGADGIGLYRTEILYAMRETFPTEDELVEEMAQVLAPLDEHRCVVRLMDIGGDKELPFLESFSESNPFLGRRGIRLLFHYQKLLRVQLRALIKLSKSFQIQIMVPMVTVADDMKRVRKILMEEAAEMGVDNPPPLVALIETPAAALCTKEIARYSDSLSVGTNDLTQYTMAAGRDNPLVSHYFQDDHPAIVRLLRLVCREAADKQVFICGELAGRLDTIPTLLDAGVQMLSVAPPVIPSVKQAVRKTE